MKRKFIVRPLAEIDQATHFLFLGKRNPAVAHRFLDAMAAALARIRKDPGFGVKLNIPRHEAQDVRFYRPNRFESYVLLFRVTDDSIIVLRILHGSQDIDAALSEP
ncbi:MAG: type II toxin-antitoxin system RelE/ParE family toxin [Planctomycetaceae bacterium]|nr:type II toxin-antitoxin system RelE/ParE family toxin [Planctomycetaceae bacterium]